MANELMAAALAYRALGYSILPLKPKDKIPLLPSWTQYQTEPADREEIGSWWRRWPTANLGIVTGAVSGLVVIDCDSPEACVKILFNKNFFAVLKDSSKALSLARR